jgi:DNA-binding beta-propeller fold protein YncE
MNKKLFILLGLQFLILLDVQGVFSRIGSDPSHMEVVATLSFENEPLGVAVNEVTGRVYISAGTGFSVVDSETDELLNHVPLHFEVGFIAVNPVKNHIFVNGRGSQNLIYVLDGVTYSVVGEIDIGGVLSYPQEFALNPTMDRIYISDRASVMGEMEYVRVYDAQNFSLLTSIEIPGSSGHPFIENLWVAVNPQMNLLYITWTGDNSIRLIDCETNEILKTVTPQEYGHSMIVNQVTGYVYTGYLVLDGTSLEELAQLSDNVEALNPIENNVVICSRGNLMSNILSSYVSILDDTSYEVLATLALEWGIDEYSQSVAVNTVTGKIYVVHKEDRKVSVIEERNGPHNHVVINEFELNPPGDDTLAEEWVELYNPTSSDVDISDWILIPHVAHTYSFLHVPSDTVIEAGGYYTFVIYRGGREHEDAWIELGESLEKVVDITPVKTDLEDDDRTWQRSPDGCDHWVFQKSTKPVTPVTEDLVPVVDTGGPYGGKVDDPVWFDGSGSYDPDGENVLCEWDFGDGTTKEGVTCSHIYEESGTYTVTLTVTDAAGNIATDQTTVTVLPREDFPFWIIGVFFFAAVIIGTAVTAILRWRRRK